MVCPAIGRSPRPDLTGIIGIDGIIDIGGRVGVIGVFWG